MTTEIDASRPEGNDNMPPSLSQLPDELWRKIASCALPRTTRALICIVSDSSLRRALRADTERAERTLFGMTRTQAVAYLDRLVSSGKFRRLYPHPKTVTMQNCCKVFKHLFFDGRSLDLELVRVFLAYGCDPNYAEYDGTALHKLDDLIYCGYFNVTPIAKLLVAAGADVRTTEPGLPPREDSRHTALDNTYATLDLLLNRWGAEDRGARHGLTHMSSRYDLDHDAATACAELIWFLVGATFARMLPLGQRGEADCKAVMCEIRTQEADFVRHRTKVNNPGWSKTFYEVTASYLEFLDAKAEAGAPIPGGDDFARRMLRLHKLTMSLTRDDGSDKWVEASPLEDLEESA